MIAESGNVVQGRIEGSPGSLQGHILALAAVLVLAVLAYLPTLRSYYCGYDDFNEAYRAGFEDRLNPALMFTTSHFHTSKYRPLNRLLTLIAWSAGNGNPAAYRIRNLGFHIAVAFSVYGIALLLFDSGAGAFAASLLFAIHPLVNQSVVGATWTNTAAYAFMFASLYFFMRSLRRDAVNYGDLAAALILGVLGLFTYEATIVVFGLAILYSALRIFFAGGARPPLRFFGFAAAGAAIACGLFLWIRSLFAGGGTSVAPARAVLQNAVVYLGAMIDPVDPVLAHSWFGVPLPSELLVDPEMFGPILLVLLTASLVPLAGISFLISWLRKRGRLHIDWRLVFLAGAMVISLSPFLLLTAHASETYLYPETAFLCILLVFIGRKLLPRKVFRVAAAVLAVVFGAGTLVRNDRVLACGTTASRILSALPAALRTGVHTVIFSPFPDEPPSARYGIYGWSGIGTIDPGSAGSATSALRIATGNPLLTASVVAPAGMAALCTGVPLCFEVHSNGTLEPYSRSVRLTNAR